MLPGFLLLAKDLSDITVTPQDFGAALEDIKPAFGHKEDDFEGCIRHGIISYSSEFDSWSEVCRRAVCSVQDAPVQNL